MPDQTVQLPQNQTADDALVERSDLPEMDVPEAVDELTAEGPTGEPSEDPLARGASRPTVNMQIDEQASNGDSGSGGGDQQPAADATREAGERYLRLQVHVEDGEARVIGVSAVDGPLATAKSASGGYAWEVTVDGRRVSSDVIGDPTEWRSFGQPEGPPTQHGHHHTSVSSFDFTARVPAQDLPADALEKTDIALYRIKDAQRPLELELGRGSLAEEFSSQLRPVAQVSGLDGGQIDPDLTARIKDLATG